MKINAQSSAVQSKRRTRVNLQARWPVVEEEEEEKLHIDCFDIVSLWDNLLHNLKAV
jgi:hypothetical protein